MNIVIFFAVLMILLGTGVLVLVGTDNKYTQFIIDEMPQKKSSYSILGLVSCIALILIGSMLLRYEIRDIRKQKNNLKVD